MVAKVHLTSNNMATFTCPLCQKTKTVNVSKYASLDKVIKVRVTCPCGHVHTCLLDKRRKYRKDSNLPGSFVHLVDGRQASVGLMAVKDLSESGLKIQLNEQREFEVNDVFLVEFHLDDRHRSLIKKKVIVRNVVGKNIGAEFVREQDYDE